MDKNEQRAFFEKMKEKYSNDNLKAVFKGLNEADDPNAYFNDIVKKALEDAEAIAKAVKESIDSKNQEQEKQPKQSDDYYAGYKTAIDIGVRNNNIDIVFLESIKNNAVSHLLNSLEIIVKDQNDKIDKEFFSNFLIAANELISTVREIKRAEKNNKILKDRLNELKSDKNK